MPNADYRTAMKDGVDAARSGSRMVARLHLLKAADFAPQEVGCHLWLAWVAETPADALAHLDDALARNPQHALARVGRLWTKLMAEFDAARDYAELDADALGESLPEKPSPGTAPGMAATIRFSATTPLDDLAESRGDAPADPSQSRADNAAADNAATGDEAAGDEDDTFDMTHTVRMDLVRRRLGMGVDESLAETCLMSDLAAINEARAAAEELATESPAPPEPGSAEIDGADNLYAESASTEPEPESPPPSDENGQGEYGQGEYEPDDQELEGGTIRLGPGAVKRALAETVIAEMTSPDRASVSAASTSSSKDASPIVESEPTARQSDADADPASDASEAATASCPSAAAAKGDRPRIDEFTEPPPIALSPDESGDRETDERNRSRGGPRVLVVDDSPTVRKLVSSTLESRGYRVASVGSGYEAVEILSQTTPDALVIEVDLPRLDGLHLCKLLRSQDATRQTPVIFLTHRKGTLDRMRCKLVGATAYLTKPFRSVSLLDELAACCPVEAN